VEKDQVRDLSFESSGICDFFMNAGQSRRL
jgi:hypothetical protein